MKFSVKSDKGLVREVNEDSFMVMTGYTDLPDTFMIADGMGGHRAGEVASRAALEHASNYILSSPGIFSNEDDIPRILELITTKSNEKVFVLAKSKVENFGMGTTLIIAIFLNHKIYISHVGDSRVYLIRNATIQRLTSDHSLVEELVKIGSITQEEADNHPKRNIITRALGCTEEVKPDIYIHNIQDGDTFLLCTDGLTNMVEDTQILKKVLETNDTSEICSTLVKEAIDNGGEDNITVIVLRKAVLEND